MPQRAWETTKPLLEDPNREGLLDAWRRDEIPPDVLNQAGVPPYRAWQREGAMQTPESPREPSLWERILHPPEAERRGEEYRRQQEEIAARTGGAPAHTLVTKEGEPYVGMGDPMEEYEKYYMAGAKGLSLPLRTTAPWDVPAKRSLWEAGGREGQEPVAGVRPYAEWEPGWGRKGTLELLGDPLIFIGGGVGKAVQGEKFVMQALKAGKTSWDDILKGLERLGIKGEEVNKIFASASKKFNEQAAKTAAKASKAAEAIAPKVPPISGTVPPKPPVTPPPTAVVPPKPPSGSVQDITHKMWDYEARVAKPTFREKVASAQRFVEENLLDKFAGINKLTAKARKAWKKQHKTELPLAYDAENYAARIGGAAEAGVQRSYDTWRKMRGALGDVPVETVDDFLHWRHNIDVLKIHPERKISGGLTAEQCALGIRELEQRLGPQGFAKLQAGAKALTDHWAQYLQRGVDTGLIDKELATQLRSMYPHYNPIAYIDDLAKAEMGGLGKALSVAKNDLSKLSEFGNIAARERPTNTLARLSVQKETLIMRNEAAKAIAKLVEIDPSIKAEIARLGKRGVDTLSWMENGVRQQVTVPKWLADEAKLVGLMPEGVTKHIMDVGQKLNAASRAGMTTINLAFFIPNFAVDSLTAMLSHGVGPFRVGKRLLLGLKNIVSEDKLLATLRREGGAMSGFWGKRPDQIAKDVTKSGNIVLKNEGDWARLLRHPLELISAIGHAVEMAPRSAVLERELAKGIPMEQAILAARRATIDFQRSGTAIRFANSLYLYLNAGVQGSMIPFRALRDKPATWFRLAGLEVMTLMTYAWNRQYPEYEDVPDWAKYGAWIVMLPSEEYDKRGKKVPHYIAVVPNMREWSLFTGPQIYLLRKLDEKDSGDMGQFLDAWFPNLNPFSQIVGAEGSSMAMMAPTQAVKTFTDLARNHDSFRNRPIVPEELENEPSGKQFNQWTSLSARKVGEAIGYSPMKIDYFVRNMFGGVGRQVIDTMDVAIRALEGESEDFRVQSAVSYLKSIQETVIPEEIPAARRDYLESLPPELREKVLDAEMKPEPVIPVITQIMRRVYREYGGQVWDTAKRQAQQAMKDAPPESEEPLEELRSAAQENAVNLLNNQISRKVYDSQRERYRAYYAGRSAQSWRAKELAGAMAGEDVQQYLPEEYRWTPKEKALSDYHNHLTRFIADEKGILNKENWDRIYKRLDSWLATLPADQKDYVLRHKDDWINELSQEGQYIERLRAEWIESGRWWQGYSELGLKARGGARPSGGVPSFLKPSGGGPPGWLGW